MRKAAGREAAGKKKSRKAEEPKKTAGKRSSPKAARSGAFDADALLNSMEGMVFVASRDYRIEYMNEAARRKIGRDMTGKHCFTVFHGLEERCPWCMGEFVLQGQTIRQEIQGQMDKLVLQRHHAPLSQRRLRFHPGPRFRHHGPEAGPGGSHAK
jgi:PAS domain-containing protein